MRLYEWVHDKWPKLADCRPIFVERALLEAGFEIVAARNSQDGDA
jgi:hypothetical protein